VAPQPAALTARELAPALGCSEDLVRMALGPLRNAGLVLHEPGDLYGPGAYRLARPADRITLLEVVEAADGPVRGLARPVGDDPGPEAGTLTGSCRRCARRWQGWCGGTWRP
jgi:DNA-binding IscR family transcriptional regulator